MRSLIRLISHYAVIIRTSVVRSLLLLTNRLVKRLESVADPEKLNEISPTVASIIETPTLEAADFEPVERDNVIPLHEVPPQDSDLSHAEFEAQISQLTTAMENMQNVFTGSEWSKLIRNARDGGASSILAGQVLAKTAKLLEYGLNNVLQMTKAAEDVKNASVYLSTISDDIKLISNQSRIVSINASIEANRAGDHGRTFQVVSQQMTELSEDVRKLTLSIDSSLDSVNQKIDLNKVLCGKVEKLFTNLNFELEEFRKQMMRVEELSVLQVDQLKQIEIKLTKEVTSPHQIFKQSPNRKDYLAANH